MNPVRIVAKALVTNYASIVAEFLKSLHCLREQFRDSELWNTQVVVHRVEAMLNNLGDLNIQWYIDAN